ncbi:hypothetical protein XELAEV_18042994mg [Xenopus laevis]|uniref:Uncharacterized protein n=1 Tax=Xenopus laevis TaxID=8355 RepID=A0A974C565_XENLA|nr:hypothetical protein XELAEV_18042994mg [Xenopus laevis]
MGIKQVSHRRERVKCISRKRSGFMEQLPSRGGKGGTAWPVIYTTELSHLLPLLSFLNPPPTLSTGLQSRFSINCPSSVSLGRAGFLHLWLTARPPLSTQEGTEYLCPPSYLLTLSLLTQ